MKKSFLFSTLCAALLSPSFMLAENVSIGAQAGIFGLGLNAKYKLNDHVGIRGGFDMMDLNDIEEEADGVNYNFDVSLQDVMVVADWHPWMGSFKTSAGLIVNGSNVDGYISPSASQGNEISFEFDGKDYTYTLDQLGGIEATADFDPVAPYIGIGWDTSFDKDSGFGFTFDLGIAYQGSMKSSYELKFGEALDIEKATAGIPDGAQKDAKIAEIKAAQQQIKDELGAQLDKEMKTLQDELDKYSIMPYISMGFNYKF